MSRPPLPEAALLSPATPLDQWGYPTDPSGYLAAVAAEERAVGLAYVHDVAHRAYTDLGLGRGDRLVTERVADAVAPMVAGMATLRERLLALVVSSYDAGMDEPVYAALVAERGRP